MWQGELSSHEANLTKSWLTQGAPRQPVPVKGVCIGQKWPDPTQYLHRTRSLGVA